MLLNNSSAHSFMAVTCHICWRESPRSLMPLLLSSVFFSGKQCPVFLWEFLALDCGRQGCRHIVFRIGIQVSSSVA